MDSLKILSADISNFKNIEKKVVSIDGRSLVVIGSNANGKSSFIQALLSPLDSQYVPAKPITDGEERGSLKVVIGGEVDGIKKTYNVDLYFTPANNKGRLVVTNELGEAMTPPKTFLKGLIGNIGFDIFQFLRSKPKEQVEILKQIAGINFTQINKERQQVYDERTYVNKKIQEQEALLKNHGYSAEEVAKYQSPVDVTPIKNKIAELGKSVETYANIESGLKSRQDKINAVSAQIKKNNEEIASLEAKIIMLKRDNENADAIIRTTSDEIKKAELWLQKNERPDISKLNQELNDAEEHNRHVEKLSQYKTKNVELNNLKSKTDELTEKIDKIDKQKEEMISKSKLPVKGLTFSDEAPLFNGLPLEEGQINKAKLIEIGARIGMALNPTLKVLFVYDASLLDKQSLKSLVELCEKEGYQLFLEIVNFEGGELDIKFTEEFIV